MSAADAPRPTPRAGCASPRYSDDVLDALAAWYITAHSRTALIEDLTRAEHRLLAALDVFYASVPPASAPAATPLMDSLRDCDEKAKDLPRWATDINAAHAAQYDRPAATPTESDRVCGKCGHVPHDRHCEVWIPGLHGGVVCGCTERSLDVASAPTSVAEAAVRLAQGVAAALGDNAVVGPHLVALTALLSDFDDQPPFPPARPTGEEAETRRVQQEDPLGCGVACLAMVSGRTYAEVRATVNPAQVEVGLADQTIIWWLNRERIWHRRSWMDGEWGYPVPSSGLALMLTHDAHWVVLEDGVVLDPARPTPLPRYDFRQAIEVLSPPRLTAQATALAALRARESELLMLLQRVATIDEASRRYVLPLQPSGILPDALRADLRAALAPRQPMLGGAPSTGGTP